jgi:hypothetical protein
MENYINCSNYCSFSIKKVVEAKAYSDIDGAPEESAWYYN